MMLHVREQSFKERRVNEEKRSTAPPPLTPFSGGEKGHHTITGFTFNNMSNFRKSDPLSIKVWE
jgi:hypothetical protein